MIHLHISRKGVKILLSFFVPTIMLWFCNKLWDSRYTFGKGDDSIVSAFLSKKLFEGSTHEIKGILPINTAYDSELVCATDEFGIPIGRIDITDRSKLFLLLSRLKEYNNYRYILCDIAFDTRYKSESDSLLFNLIASMSNIVVPKDSKNFPEILAKVSGTSNYKVFHHGDLFLKYQYISQGERSIPLRMWNEITGNDITRHWWGYSSNDHFLCNNAAVLDLANIVDYSTQTVTTNYGGLRLEKKLIYNLGSDILDVNCPRTLFEDKIILIGDFFEHDMHDTAIGPLPGVMILYAAYQALDNGKNAVPLLFYLILWCVFLVYTVFLLFGKGWKIEDRFLAFVVDSFSFTLPLKVFNYITVVFGGVAVNAVLIGSFFGLISYINNKINQWKKIEK